MTRVRSLVALAVVGAAIGVVGPAIPAADAQCDPEPVALDDGSGSGRGSGCANNCQKLGEAVERITRQSLWACTQ